MVWYVPCRHFHTTTIAHLHFNICLERQPWESFLWVRAVARSTCAVVVIHRQTIGYTSQPWRTKPSSSPRGAISNYIIHTWELVSAMGRYANTSTQLPSRRVNSNQQSSTTFPTFVDHRAYRKRTFRKPRQSHPLRVYVANHPHVIVPQRVCRPLWTSSSVCVDQRDKSVDW